MTGWVYREQVTERRKLLLVRSLAIGILGSSTPKPDTLTISDLKIARAVATMSQRSERQSDASKLVSSFVDVGVLPQIDNNNNQIIFGRRGTGKTRILKVLQTRCIGRGMAAVYTDARTFGSSAQYTDPGLSLRQRCLALFRDLLSILHDGLLEFVVNGPAGPANHALELLDQLADSIRDDSMRTETNALTVKSIKSKKRSDSFKLSSSIKENLYWRYSDAVENGSQHETTAQMSVTKEDKIFFPSIHLILAEILANLNTSLFLFIDEWSSLPQDIQPYFAEFIRRSFFAIPSVVVKIAALEQRCTFGVHGTRGIIGFELGSDIGASLT